MKRLVAGVAAAVAAGCAAAPANDPAAAEVTTRDVHAFVAAYASLDPADPSCRGLESYFEDRTPGLRTFRKIMGRREDLCLAIRRRPEPFDELGSQLGQIDSLATEIRRIYRDFAGFYPDAMFPDVHFAVGRFMAAGSHRRGRIYLGVERIQSLDRIPCLVIHELAHAQQRYRMRDLRLSGGPRLLRGTVLAHSLKEGSADLVAELFAGCPVRTPEYVSAHEDELWEAFRRDMFGRDFSMWLYNGWNRERLGDRPVDLGYHFGYRVAKAYHDRAADKNAALREILSIRDFRRFFQESGCDAGC